MHADAPPDFGYARGVAHVALVDTHLWALAATFVLWWAGTAAVLGLVRIRRRRGQVFAAATLCALAALAGAHALGARVDPTAAALSFTCGLVVWAWNEMAFLMGYVTGPREHACEAGCEGPAHVLHAVGAIAYHELALLVSAGALFAATAGAENRVGLWTFVILWVMRISAKLNLFLGVRNLAENWLPGELQHLRPYLRHRRMNPLFPVSVLGATGLFLVLARRAVLTEATPFDVAGGTMLATLAALGLLEHWLLVLPFDPTRLWSWTERRRLRR